MKKSLYISLRWATVAVLCTLLSGCFIKPYRFDLFQGNIINPSKVAQIEPGMTREQVRYILGSPMLNDVFETERWDYIYMERRGHHHHTRLHLAIYFDEGRVIRITNDTLPDADVA